jgi:hypothetical protein
MMKIRIFGVAFLAASSVAFAAAPPEKGLVDSFLSSAGVEQAIDGQLDAYTEMLGDKMPDAARKKALDYMNSTMGWGAIKEPYAALVAKTYTADELKAAIAYFTSPLGASAVKKDRQFQHDLVTLLARNAELAAKGGSASASAKFDGAGNSSGDIVAAGVEEHVNDGQTYFTGALENHGKQSSSNVQVEINLFLGGKFVDQYSTYVTGSVTPDAPRYFKVTCGCKGSPPASHDTFKVNVVAAF